MTTMKGLERLVLKRWPKLKERAQHERNPEKLIEILEEIDDLLFNLELRIAAASGNSRSRAGAEEISAGHAFPEGSSPGDPEIENQ